MGLKRMALEAYYKAEALEALLVAKGIIQTGEVEAWREEFIKKEDERRKQESERREIELRESWDRIQKGDLIRFNYHKIKEGTVVAKGETPWGSLTVTGTIKNRWRRSKKSEYTLCPIYPMDITVEHKGQLHESVGQ